MNGFEFKKFASIMHIDQLKARYKQVREYHNTKSGLPDLPEQMCKTNDFSISEKIHGTNGCIIVPIDKNIPITVQSRNNFLNAGFQDNCGFAEFIKSRDKVIQNILGNCNRLPLSTDSNPTIALRYYGEFAGKNIQGKSAMTDCEKHFILFPEGFTKILSDGTEEKCTLSIQVSEENTLLLKEHNILMPKYIDMQDHGILELNLYSEDCRNKLNNLVTEIENKSPLGTLFGKENIGEGIVVSFWCSELKEQLTFKMKGDKHTKSVKRPKQPKQGKASDEEEILLHTEALALTPNWRLEQFYNELNVNGQAAKIGAFIKAVIEDIRKEESYKYEHKAQHFKGVLRYVPGIVKNYFKEIVAI